MRIAKRIEAAKRGCNYLSTIEVLNPLSPEGASLKFSSHFPWIQWLNTSIRGSAGCFKKNGAWKHPDAGLDKNKRKLLLLLRLWLLQIFLS